MEKKRNEKKMKKENRILETAFDLFTEKGLKETSIQDIVDTAGVGKGTFYLYFKDKYDIRDSLIEKKSSRLFSDAIEALHNSYIKNFEDQIIFVINYVIDQLTKNPILLQFLSKDLSWGVYNKTINKWSDTDGIYALFLKGLEETNQKMKNSKVTLFMIIELVSSTCFNSILYQKPLPIEEYKPYLYETIRFIINNAKED